MGGGGPIGSVDHASASSASDSSVRAAAQRRARAKRGRTRRVRRAVRRVRSAKGNSRVKGNSDGHGNGNACGHGKGGGRGNGGNNGNAGGNGNGNACGHGNGDGDEDDSDEDEDGDEDGDGDDGGDDGESGGGGNPSPGGGNPDPGQNPSPGGNPNFDGNPTGDTNGDPGADGKAGGNTTGNANGGTRSELLWLDEAVAALGSQVHEFQRLRQQALEDGDRRGAHVAFTAAQAALKTFWRAVAIRAVAEELLVHRDEYLRAVANGDEDLAAKALEQVMAAYGRTAELFQEAEPEALPPATPPKQGESVTVAPSGGVVLVDRPGPAGPTPLLAGSTVPTGSVVDTRYGRVELTSIANSAGQAQTADFQGAIFKVVQKPGRALTDLVLTGGNLASCAAASSRSATASLVRSKVARRLWGHGKGRFRTRGRWGSATVRGTYWLTEDTCKGTRVYVKRGVVGVRDFSKRRTIELWPGEQYLARARP